MADGVCRGNEEGHDECQRLTVNLLGVTDQLHRAAQSLGDRHMISCNAGDAVRCDLVGIQKDSKGKRRQNGDLSCRVQTFYVGGGICLGVAQTLCLLEDLLKSGSLTDHLGEDKVGGTVEDSAHRHDLVGGKVGLHRTDDRNTAAHARLKEIAHAVLTGNVQKLGAKVSDNLLVGGHHVLPRAQCRDGKIIGGMRASHHLGNQSHLGIVQNDIDIMDHTVSQRMLGEITQIQNVLDIYLVTDTGSEELFVFLKNLSRTASNHTKA